MVENKLFFETADVDLISAFAKRINDEKDGGEIGYYHLPEFSLSIVEEAKKLNQNFENIVLIGIGGSSVGVRAVQEMLKGSQKDNKKLYILDNVDNFSYKEVIKNIEFSKTIFIISSKSGTTIETISLFKAVLAEFNVKNFSENFIFITDPNSALEIYAKKKGAKVFSIPENVGGRFSILSAIGVVPLTLLGFDAGEILRGAKACKEKFLSQKDPKILQKAYHYATHKNATINVLFSYCDRLKYFNEWYIQLWAESLGKKKGFLRYGLTPVGLVGSRDQHSFLQLIMDGTRDKTLTFIKVKDHGFDDKIPNISLENLEGCDFVNLLKMSEIINYQCEATMHAVINEGVSVDLIELDRLDEFNVGYLIYYYELLTSAVGVMYGVNTYDQPGVEIGKRILKTLVLKNS